MDNEIKNINRNNYDKDEAIVQQIKFGNQKAEDELYRKYYRKLISKLVNYNIDINDAEDLLQDTMIVVIARIKNGKYKHQGTLFPYIQGVSWRIYKKFVSNNKYHSIISDKENIIELNQDNDDIQIIKEKRIQYIIQAYRSLDVFCHDLLKYSYFDGLKPSQMVNILPNVETPEQISKRKYKCMEKLKRKTNKLMKNEKSS